MVHLTAHFSLTSHLQCGDLRYIAVADHRPALANPQTQQTDNDVLTLVVRSGCIDQLGEEDVQSFGAIG